MSRRGRAAVAGRPCPTCGATVRVRSARWCGTCGAPLAAGIDRVVGDRRPRRRLAVGTGVLALVAATAVAAGVLPHPGTGGGATDVSGGAVTAPDDAVFERLGRRSPDRPPPVAAPTCARSTEAGCFLWTAQLDRAASDTVTAIRGHLLMHRTGNVLVARDLRTGGEAWTSRALAGTQVEAAHLADGTLVVVGRRAPRAGTGARPAVGVAAGLDPATGSLRWERTGRSASLARDGTAVIASRDGRLLAIGPAGHPRWEVAPRRSEVTAVAASGHLIRVVGADGGQGLYRLHDGTPLGQPARVLASDEEHTLLARPSGGGEEAGRATPTTGQFVLLDASGREVWRAAGAGRNTCIQRAAFTATAVEVRLCHGGSVGFHRTEGFVLARPPTAGSVADEADPSLGPRVGPYGFRIEAGTGDTEVHVVDARTGDRPVARLPHGARFVLGRDGDPDLGGVVVLRAGRWLAAFAIPPHGGHRP